MQRFENILERFLVLCGMQSQWAHMHVRQLLKFGLTGGTAMFLDLILLSFAIEVLLLSLVVAGPMVTALVIIYVFFLNKYWTFGNCKKKHLEQGMKFLLVYGSSFILVNAMTIFLTEYLFLWYLLSRVIAIFICAFWNYTWMHITVFR